MGKEAGGDSGGGGGRRAAGDLLRVVNSGGGGGGGKFQLVLGVVRWFACKVPVRFFWLPRSTRHRVGLFHTEREEGVRVEGKSGR